MTKRFFITGGAGFIGSTFVAQRIEAGDEVIVYDKFTYAGHRQNLDWIEDKNDNLEIIKGDICDQQFVSRLLKKYEVDYVINFAAESHVDNSISGSEVFIKTNINGTYSMLEAARSYYDTLTGAKKEQFRYIQISTDEVYGTLGDTGKFSEDTPMKPNSPYSSSKAAGDHLARAWFETYNLPTIVTNCTNNYGPRQFPEKLIPFMISKAIAGDKMGIYGDGKNIRDWIHVEDHCNGVYLAATKGIAGQTYCFGGDAEKNNIEMVKTICAILDNIHDREDKESYYSQVEFVKDRAGHDFRYAIDDSKAQDKLGFKRKYTYEQGMFDTVKWYLENKKWCDEVIKTSSKD